MKIYKELIEVCFSAAYYQIWVKLNNKIIRFSSKNPQILNVSYFLNKVFKKDFIITQY